MKIERIVTSINHIALLALRPKKMHLPVTSLLEPSEALQITCIKKKQRPSHRQKASLRHVGFKRPMFPQAMKLGKYLSGQVSATYKNPLLVKIDSEL